MAFSSSDYLSQETETLGTRTFLKPYKKRKTVISLIRSSSHSSVALIRTSFTQQLKASRATDQLLSEVEHFTAGSVLAHSVISSEKDVNNKLEEARKLLKEVISTLSRKGQQTLGQSIKLLDETRNMLRLKNLTTPEEQLYSSTDLSLQDQLDVFRSEVNEKFSQILTAISKVSQQKSPNAQSLSSKKNLNKQVSQPENKVTKASSETSS